MSSRLLSLVLVFTSAACGRLGFDPRLACGTDDPFADVGDDPITICTAAHLRAMADHPEHWDKAFQLGDDLELAGVEIAMIGTQEVPFTGSFDGKGFTIANLALDLPTEPRVALFARVLGPVEIANVTMTDVVVNGGAMAAALVADASDAPLRLANIEVRGTITGVEYAGGLVAYQFCEGDACGIAPLPTAYADLRATVDVRATGETGIAGTIAGSVTSDSSSTLAGLRATGFATSNGMAGGIVGYFERAHLRDCLADVTVTASAGGGGIAGGSSYGFSTITDARSTGSITCSGGTCGGIVGFTEGPLARVAASGDISCGGDFCGGLVGHHTHDLDESYSTANVTGVNDVGGLTGFSEDAVRDSWSSGRVMGLDRVGGLFGSAYGDAILRSYAAGMVIGRDQVGGIGGEITGGAATRRIEDVFATTDVMVTSSSTNASPFIGSASVPVDLTRTYAVQGRCRNADGLCMPGGGQEIDLDAQPDYFTLTTSAPFSTWDFAVVWEAVPGGMPRLRRAP